MISLGGGKVGYRHTARARTQRTRTHAHARTHAHTNKQTKTHTHKLKCTHARTHTYIKHTYTRTHIRTHGRTHARTHTQTARLILPVKVVLFGNMSSTPISSFGRWRNGPHSEVTHQIRPGSLSQKNSYDVEAYEFNKHPVTRSIICRNYTPSQVAQSWWSSAYYTWLIYSFPIHDWYIH